MKGGVDENISSKIKNVFIETFDLVTMVNLSAGAHSVKK